MTPTRWLHDLYDDPITTILSVNAASCETSVLRQFGLLSLPWCCHYTDSRSLEADISAVRTTIIRNSQRLGLSVDSTGRVARASLHPNGRHQREVASIMTASALLLCAENNSAAGLDAIDRWSQELASASRYGTIIGPVCLTRSRLWLNFGHLSARYLLHLAGSASSRYSNRLREAATVQHDAVEDCLAPLVTTFENRTFVGAADLLKRYHQSMELAASLILEAGLIGIELPASLQRALLEPPSEPLDAQSLSELAYFARAGTPSLQMLSFRRLSQSSDSRAVSLSQITRSD